MDIVGYAGFSTGRQHAFKQALSRLLQPPEKPLQDHGAQLRDTPSGVQMVFLSRPEHAALMALRLLHALQAAEPTPAAPLQPGHLRMGLHFGTVHEGLDMEKRTCYLGEGIRTSAYLMEAAAPGQALASSAFFEQLEYLTHGAEALFQAAVALPGEGTGQTCAYPLSTQPAALAALERRVQDMPAPAALASELNKNIQTVQGWLTPVNVLVTFGTFLITVIGRFTDQARAMNAIAAVLLVFALVLALLWRMQRIPAWKKRLDERYGGHLRAWATGATTALVLAASGAMALAAWVTTQDAAPALATHTPQPADTSPAPAASSAAATAALPAGPAAAPPDSADRDRATTASSAPAVPNAPEAAPVSAAPSASVPAPPPAPPSAAAVAHAPAQATRPSATAEVRKRPGPAALADAAPERPSASAQATAPSPVLLARRPAAAAGAAPAAPASARPERCALILQKASIDEPLSAQDKNFLFTACK